MFSKFALLSSLAILAAANTIPASQCVPGPVQCCQSVQNSNTAAVQVLLALLGITISGTTIPVGITCTPITVIGAGSGASCAAQPVCCLDNSHGGIVAIGCTPVDLSL